MLSPQFFFSFSVLSPPLALVHQKTWYPTSRQMFQPRPRPLKRMEAQVLHRLCSFGSFPGQSAKQPANKATTRVRMGPTPQSKPRSRHIGTEKRGGAGSSSFIRCSQPVTRSLARSHARTHPQCLLFCSCKYFQDISQNSQLCTP